MLKSPFPNFIARWTGIVAVDLALAPNARAADVTSAPELFAGLEGNGVVSILLTIAEIAGGVPVAALENTAWALRT